MKPVLTMDLDANARPARKARTRSRGNEPQKGDPLTSRQAEVCLLLREGLMVKEIAGKLGISFHTADAHIRGVYVKLGVRSRAELFRRFESGSSIEVTTTRTDAHLSRILDRLEAIETQLVYISRFDRPAASAPPEVVPQIELAVGGPRLTSNDALGRISDSISCSREMGDRSA
jgi:DNA-binding CsgD family transcriptional regulator